MQKYFLALAVSGLVAQASYAAFPVDGTVSSKQTLSSGTGIVSGTVSTSGGTIGVEITGSNTTLINYGTIQQTATGRAVRITTDATVVEILNHGLVKSTGEDAIQLNIDPKPVERLSIVNTGTIDATGGQAIDFNKALTGSNTVTNSGLITANGEDAVRPGVNGLIINSGTIRANPIFSGGSASGSDGVDTQTNSGVVIQNDGFITGRHGITGGDTADGVYQITITNGSNGVISAINGSAINIDGVNTRTVATITNYGLMTGEASPSAINGDGDGVDVDGLVVLDNYGKIQGLGASGSGSDTFTNTVEGLAIGGGTVTNHAGAEISGKNQNGSSTEANGILVDNSSKGSALAAATITNGGIIRGYSGYGIRIIGGWDNTITNLEGGVIQGTQTVIQTGSGNDLVVNSGAIIAENGAMAIDLGGGNNTLRITGGAASIIGNVSGGIGGSNTFTADLGAGHRFLYSGTLSHFSTVQIVSGETTFTEANTYSGVTEIGTGGTLVVSNTAGSATGSSDVNILSGGTLAGDGRIDGDVQLASGATLALGHNGRALKIGGGLSVSDGAHFSFDLASLSGAATSLLEVEGTLSLANGSYWIDLVLGAGNTVGSFTLLSGLTEEEASRFSLGTTPIGFDGSLAFADGNLELHVATIPEPSSIALIVSFGVLASIRVLRRQRAA